MSAKVETMMYVREKPWHGLGTMVTEAPTSADDLKFAGLDWTVRQEPVYNSRGGIISGYKANIRDSDRSVLGIVGDRYKVVQNVDAFNFTDDLIGGEVRYETAGSLREGKQIWLLAKLPEKKIAGDAVEPYLCFTNAHDGSSGVKVCMTPVRVVCNNTLNVALSTAKRVWSMRHTESVHERLNEARDCLLHADKYMNALADYCRNQISKRYSPAKETYSPPMETWFARIVHGSKDRRELKSEEVDRLKEWADCLDMGRAIKEQLLHSLQTESGLDVSEVGRLFYCLVHGKSLLEQVEEMIDRDMARAYVDQRVMETLSVSTELAAEIRKLIFTYAADQVKEDEQRRIDLMIYGGVQ